MASKMLTVRIRSLGFVCGMLLATSALSAPDGAQLYHQHCSTCHGTNGQGGVGVPIALNSFLSSVDDRFLETTIREGRKGRVMPAFPKLSDAQISALVGHIRSWGDGKRPIFSATPIEGDIANGRTLFSKHCAVCHGEDGRGGSGTGVTFSRHRDLPIIAPALNNAGFLHAASDQLIANTIAFGREGTPMTSMLVAGLSDDDINDVVAYIRSFESPRVVSQHLSIEDEPASLIATSPYDLEETIENIKQSITDQNFTLIRTEYLEHGLVAEGKENTQEVVLHFCNFRFLFGALALDPRVGMFLPCRVTVVEREGVVQVMTVNPTRLSHLFNNDELEEACKEMRGIYSAILEDATL